MRLAACCLAQSVLLLLFLGVTEQPALLQRLVLDGELTLKVDFPGLRSAFLLLLVFCAGLGVNHYGGAILETVGSLGSQPGSNLSYGLRKQMDWATDRLGQGQAELAALVDKWFPAEEGSWPCTVQDSSFGCLVKDKIQR